MRVCLFGMAHVHANRYVESLRKHDAEIVGVWDRDEERARYWARKNGIPHYKDKDQLIGQGVDAAVVCSETVHHLEDVQTLATAKIPVLCEKPLGVNHRDSAAIVRVCQTNDVHLMTAFPARFAPTVKQVRTMAGGGELGRIRAFSGMNQSIIPTSDGSWFAEPALSGGGAIMDHVVHLADIFSWILGSQPTEVYSVANRIIQSQVVAVETSALLLLTYPGGVFASIDCSWNRPETYPTWGDLSFSIIGDAGSLEIEPMRQRLIQYGGQLPYSWIQWGWNTNELLVNEFLEAISEDRTPIVTGLDGYNATAVALAALESVKTGQPVVPEPFIKEEL